MSEALIVALMFICLIAGLALGHELAFVLGGIAVIFGYFGWGPSIFSMFASRIYDAMDNYILIAVPLFIFMAQLLDRSGILERLFTALRYLLGPIRGGLALAVVAVSVIFAACTGLIGASVVTMGLLAVPMLLKFGYSKELTTGTITASGTLGILIPPSIMLIVMGSQAQLSVGKLFAAAIVPGLVLAVLYLLYVIVLCGLDPKKGPPMPKEERAAVSYSEIIMMCLKSLVPPMVIILGVLGSIFWGVATPTEASGVGAFLSFLLVLAYKRFSWESLFHAMTATARITAMVLTVVIGASCFTGVFIGIGGGDVINDLILGLGLGKMGVFWVMMAVVFVLGMFLDWIGIVLIVLPIFLPIADSLGFDRLWFVMMVSINLQSSFLTPPLGIAMFYLKGVAPPEILMSHIYRGIVPFVILMVIGLIICTYIPQSVMWLPSVLVK